MKVLQGNNEVVRNTTVLAGENTSQIYMDGLFNLVQKGTKCSPRGKEILELRPTILEYHDPKNRVTFLKGRVINPFFQLAEAFWIICGRSDVKWLTDYNKNMANFSDDGEYFNAPYGERLRYWNKSDANSFVFNPIDQLYDVYKKIKADPDTRQAVAVIYNPLFDNFNNDTVDRPCNLILTFKLREGKLDLQVFNRSNDLHWGTFGANLCQFSTIQEMVAGWLGAEIGVYYQNTDSLHIYMDAYGAKETDKVLTAYGLTVEDVKNGAEIPEVEHFVFEDEPRMSSSFEQTRQIMMFYNSAIDILIRGEVSYTDEKVFAQLLESVDVCPDEYWKNTFYSMVAYQAHKRGNVDFTCKALDKMKDSSWKVSCLRFLSKRYGTEVAFRNLYSHLPSNVVDYIDRKGE